MTRLTLMLLLFSTTSLAQPDRNLTLAGIPGLPCEKIVEWRNDREVGRSILDWVTGFWSGWNTALAAQGERARNLYDEKYYGDAFIGAVVGYCNENPDETLFDFATHSFLSLPSVAEQ